MCSLLLLPATFLSLSWHFWSDTAPFKQPSTCLVCWFWSYRDKRTSSGVLRWARRFQDKSRTADTNLDWVFLEKAPFFVVLKIGRPGPPLDPPFPTPPGGVIDPKNANCRLATGDDYYLLNTVVRTTGINCTALYFMGEQWTVRFSCN